MKTGSQVQEIVASKCCYPALKVQNSESPIYTASSMRGQAIIILEAVRGGFSNKIVRKLRNHKEVLVSRRFHMTHNLNGIRIGIPSATCTFFRCTLRMSCRPFTSGMGTVILVSNRPGLIRALCDAHYEGLVLIKIGSAVKNIQFSLRFSNLCHVKFIFIAKRLF